MKKYIWQILLLFSIFSLPFGVNAISCQVPDETRKAKSALVTWTTQEGAVFYNLKLMTKKGKKIKVFKNTTSLKKQISKKYLTSNKTYSVKVRGLDETMQKLHWSDIKKFRTKPAGVKNVRTENNINNSIDVVWNEVRGKNITYRINVYDNSGNKLYSFDSPSTRLTLTILGHNNNYQVKVKAKYNKNNIGSWSEKHYFFY